MADSPTIVSDAFSEYVRVLANTLGLTDWEITVVWGDLPDDVYARCQPSYARRAARLIFGEEFYHSSPSEQRATVVHELLHLHLVPLDELVNDSLPNALGAVSFRMFEAGYDLQVERAIDAVAVAIADMGVIPLPPTEG